MVRGAWADRDYLLGHVSSAFALGNGNQLEWIISLRAAFPPGADLCCDRSSFANWLVVDRHGLDHLAGEYPLHCGIACDLFLGKQYYAPAAIANLQFRQLYHHRIFPGVDRA